MSRKKRKIKRLFKEMEDLLFEMCASERFDGDAIDCVYRRIFRIKNILKIRND